MSNNLEKTLHSSLKKELKPIRKEMKSLKANQERLVQDLDAKTAVLNQRLYEVETLTSKLKDPATAFNLQWLQLEDRNRTQTPEEKYRTIQNEITDFEIKFGGTFENLYGQLTDDEIDGLDEAVDVYDWRQLLERKKKLLENLKSQKKTSSTS